MHKYYYMIDDNDMQEIESTHPRKSLPILVEEIANKHISKLSENEINDMLFCGTEISIFNSEKEFIRNYYVKTSIKYCFDVVSI